MQIGYLLVNKLQSQLKNVYLYQLLKAEISLQYKKNFPAQSEE